PELDLLRLLGLFDRPISDGEFQALTAAPPIPGLTDRLLAEVPPVQRTFQSVELQTDTGPDGLESPSYRSFLDRLRNLNLVAAMSHHVPNEIDAHPLIREYFAERMKDEGGRMKAMDNSSFILPPSSFKEAHRRLYEHLKQSAPELPDNLNDMMPLYHAVAHGYRCDSHQDALDSVYRGRILRYSGYATRCLGLVGQSLATLSAFFSTGWDAPTDNLDQAGKFFVLNQSALFLRIFLRYDDSSRLLRISLKESMRAEHYEEAARAAANLNRIALTKGNDELALEYAGSCVELAEQAEQSRQHLWRLDYRLRALVGHARYLESLGNTDKGGLMAEARSIATIGQVRIRDNW
ncbi:MAG: hypothetical protein O3A00_27690, partial [Planctomycetota bacterium]|nr:hypothetical protein [Planctomycetota bacterium]